jgi:hypothetical protein
MAGRDPVSPVDIGGCREQHLVRDFGGTREQLFESAVFRSPGQDSVE